MAMAVASPENKPPRVFADASPTVADMQGFSSVASATYGVSDLNQLTLSWRDQKEWRLPICPHKWVAASPTMDHAVDLCPNVVMSTKDSSSSSLPKTK